jgi:hypothetical protein
MNAPPTSSTKIHPRPLRSPSILPSTGSRNCRVLNWIIHQYLLRRPILSPGGAFLVRPPRRTARTPMSALLARSPSGLRSRTPLDGLHE